MIIRVAWLLVLLGLPNSAAAQDESRLTPEERTERARVLFDRGRAHFNLGDYGAAIQEFEQAYVYKQLPLLLYNIAQLHALFGDRERALKVYESFVNDAPQGPEFVEAQKRIEELKRSLEERPPTRLRVSETTVSSPARPPETLTAKVAPPVASASAPALRRDRRWVWGVATGGVVLVGAAIALGVVFGSRQVVPEPDLGRLDFP